MTVFPAFMFLPAGPASERSRSAAGVLSDVAGRVPRLWQMFRRAFFHQDWDTEGDDWPDLVRNFVGDQPQAELDATAAELETELRRRGK